jgi:hypothetical protein
MICSARCATLTTMRRKPARASASICHARRGFPPATRSGFGVASESGRIRSPRPAARIIAPISGLRGIRAPQPAGRAVLELVDQRSERTERRVSAASAAEVRHHPRHVVEISGFPVAMVEAREDAEHLELPLYAHPFEIAPELGEIAAHRQAALARALPVANAQSICRSSSHSTYASRSSDTRSYVIGPTTASWKSRTPGFGSLTIRLREW